ncbi:hypothetical protein C0584_04710 [Candidatus Parcubacteria bacterium]|nr:MAG: hypothetical protein C0584_04710 [Candidatus Parcubacteria bacterium]
MFKIFGSKPEVIMPGRDVKESTRENLSHLKEGIDFAFVYAKSGNELLIKQEVKDGELIFTNEDIATGNNTSSPIKNITDIENLNKYFDVPEEMILRAKELLEELKSNHE